MRRWALVLLTVAAIALEQAWLTDGLTTMPMQFVLAFDTVRVTTLKAKNFNSAEDEFAHLVENHPLDDVEPEAHTYDGSSEGIKSVRLIQEVRRNPLNIPVDPEEEWEWYYNRLRMRYESLQKFGDETIVSKGPVEDSLVRHWMACQRKMLMKTLGVLDMTMPQNWGTKYLTRERKERLDAVGFYWGHIQPPSLTNDLIYDEDFQRRVRNNYKDWTWTPLYEELVEFQKRNGHTRVPLAHPDDLGTWAAKQRKLKDQLQPRRRKRLDEIDFDWDWVDPNPPPKPPTEENPDPPPKEQNKVPFQTRVKQLREYRSKHGDCNVPLDYEEAPGLGEWVEKTKLRKEEFSPTTVERLEGIGLEFVEVKKSKDARYLKPKKTYIKRNTTRRKPFQINSENLF